MAVLKTVLGDTFIIMKGSRDISYYWVSSCLPVDVNKSLLSLTFRISDSHRAYVAGATQITLFIQFDDDSAYYHPLPEIYDDRIWFDWICDPCHVMSYTYFRILMSLLLKPLFIFGIAIYVIAIMFTFYTFNLFHYLHIYK